MTVDHEFINTGSWLLDDESYWIGDLPMAAEQSWQITTSSQSWLHVARSAGEMCCSPLRQDYSAKLQHFYSLLAQQVRSLMQLKMRSRQFPTVELVGEFSEQLVYQYQLMNGVAWIVSSDFLIRFLECQGIRGAKLFLRHGLRLCIASELPQEEHAAMLMDLKAKAQLIMGQGGSQATNVPRVAFESRVHWVM